MTIFMVTFLVMGIAILAMAVGVLVGPPPDRRQLWRP